MLDLENLSINEFFFDDECSPDCFPFEKELNESLKSVQEKSPEELEKQWAEEDDYYSSGEDIPDCNPWRK